MRRDTFSRAVTNLPSLSKVRDRASASNNRSGMRQLPVSKREDTVGALCQWGTMGGNQHACAVAGRRKKIVQNAGFGGDIHFGRRLIADQHIGPRRQHGCEAGPGGFTAGQRARLGIGKPTEAELIEKGVDGVRDRRDPKFSFRVQYCPDAELIEQIAALQENTDVACPQ